jgi:two-component system sensor histidine kinase LytS
MNMQNSKELISIKEEIQRIEAYLKIEKARFGEKLEIIYDLDGDLQDEIPPLIIQPIVENAVKHGINKSINGGSVKISVKSQPNLLEVRIKDDGIGMTTEKVSEILQFGEDCGIGFVNVYKRLKTFYGDKASLMVESGIGKGTSVCISIPKERTEVA